MARMIALLLSAAALSACSGLYGHDEFSQYSQRKEGVTSSAGDAKAQNMTTHVDAYWPPYVGDRRIMGNGARAQRAVDCYENGGAASSARPVTNSQTNTSVTAAGASSTTNSQTKSQC